MPLNHTSKFAELTDNQFKLIGKIVVEWANIEFLQKLVLSRLLLSPEFISRTYTDIMIAVKVQEAIKEAINLHRYRYNAKIIKEDKLAEIERVNQNVNKARINRNKFAHFCWMRSNDEAIFGSNFSGGLPESKKHNKSYIIIKNEELDTLYKESYELVDTLDQILKKLPELEEEDLLRKVKAEQKKRQKGKQDES